MVFFPLIGGAWGMKEMNFSGYRSIEELKWCSEYCRKHWKRETEHIIRIAEEVSAQKFLFDLNWDMEPTCEMVEFKEEIDWEAVPFGDPEFTYQLNRHRYFLCLGQAYWLTGAEKYAVSFRNLFCAWIKANPITEGKQKTVWRTIEAGIRAENWLKSIPYFYHSKSITGEDWNLFEQALSLHGRFLYENDSVFARKSNWGVIESHGLYMIGALLPHLDSEGIWKKTAVERLCHMLETQVMEDGVHWEQSPMYQNEVLKCCLEVLRIARLTGDKLPERIPGVVRKMAHVNRFMKKPNHCQPVTGDSDETDVRDILTISAYEFSDAILKSEAYEHLDFEGIWDYGRKAAMDYEQMAVRYEESDTGILFYELKDSGNYYLKSHDRKNSNYMHFAAGSLGGGHGHMDKLHIDLAIAGKDVLVDSGRFTYVDGEERRTLKSGYAHNVPMVDGKEYTVCTDSWGVSGATSTSGCYVKQGGNITFLESGHLGYLSEGVYVRRKVLALGTDIFILMDELFGKEEHNFEQLFHFSPEGKISLNEGRATYEEEQVKAEFHFLSCGCRVEKHPCKISRHYNQLEDSEKIIVSRKAKGNTSLLTVITSLYPAFAHFGKQVGECEQEKYQVKKIPVMSAASGRKLTDKEAEGVCIYGNGVAYEVIITHQEAGGTYDYISAGGVKGLGEVMVCDLQSEDKKTLVLKW